MPKINRLFCWCIQILLPWKNARGQGRKFGLHLKAAVCFGHTFFPKIFFPIFNFICHMILCVTWHNFWNYKLAFDVKFSRLFINFFLLNFWQIVNFSFPAKLMDCLFLVDWENKTKTENKVIDTTKGDLMKPYVKS